MVRFSPEQIKKLQKQMKLQKQQKRRQASLIDPQAINKSLMALFVFCNLTETSCSLSNTFKRSF